MNRRSFAFLVSIIFLIFLSVFTPTPFAQGPQPPTPPSPTPAPLVSPQRAIPNTPAETVCGQVFFGTSCSGGFQYPIFFPCGSSTPYRWQPLDSLLPNAFYRVYDATFETTAPLCTIEYGDVTNQLASWSQYEHIASCDVCGMPPPITPTPTGGADLIVSNFYWSPAPEAFKDFSLTMVIKNIGPSNIIQVMGTTRWRSSSYCH